MPTIEEIKAQLLAKKQAEAKAKADREARESEDRLEKSRIAEQWLIGGQTVQLVVHQLDDELSGSGLSISYSPIAKHPGMLDAFEVAVSGAAKAKISVYVNEYGRATSRLELPQVSKPGDGFDVADFNADQFRDYLLAFVGEAIKR